VAALQDAGLDAEAAASETYVRLQMIDPASGRETKGELVAEFLSRPPVDGALGPVLHPDDIAAGKMTALFSRAEVRDFIDVDPRPSRPSCMAKRSLNMRYFLKSL